MSEFTPGPWYISVDNRNCPSVRSKGGYVCFAPSIHNYGDPLRYMDEATEGQYNSRLIASAPDMYDAIKAALADDPDWRRLCVDALAKAEGRTK